MTCVADTLLPFSSCRVFVWPFAIVVMATLVRDVFPAFWRRKAMLGYQRNWGEMVYLNESKLHDMTVRNKKRFDPELNRTGRPQTLELEFNLSFQPPIPFGQDNLESEMLIVDMVQSSSQGEPEASETNITCRPVRYISGNYPSLCAKRNLFNNVQYHAKNPLELTSQNFGLGSATASTTSQGQIPCELRKLVGNGGITL